LRQFLHSGVDDRKQMNLSPPPTLSTTEELLLKQSIQSIDKRLQSLI